jgi:hypothetical protein
VNHTRITRWLDDKPITITSAFPENARSMTVSLGAGLEVTIYRIPKDQYRALLEAMPVADDFTVATFNDKDIVAATKQDALDYLDELWAEDDKAPVTVVDDDDASAV